MFKNYHRLSLRLVLVVGVEVGSVLSERNPWIEAMSTCANNDNETSVPENETSWAGQARYNMNWGE